MKLIGKGLLSFDGGGFTAVLKVFASLLSKMVTINLNLLLVPTTCDSSVGTTIQHQNNLTIEITISLFPQNAKFERQGTKK